jgi:preprotein translocase subunit SecB
MIKARFSPLRIVDFALLRSHFELISSETEIHFRKVAPDYTVNTDFAITSDEQNLQKVFMKIAVNQIENPLPGYGLFAEGVGIFQLLEEDKLSDEDKISLQYSAVSIVLNNLRAFLSNLSAYGPLGKYLLPSIDLNDLFNQKIDTRKERVSPKKNAKEGE